MTRTISLLMFDDVEVLDACGPFEVFSVANRVAERQGLSAPFHLTLVNATDALSVTARGGLRILTDCTVSVAGPADIVLVPGGVVDTVEHVPAVLDWIRRARTDAELVASVCTGAFILASAGILDQRPVTTHWEDISDLRERYPELDVQEGIRFIDHGDIATSAGISAGLDLSLHLVARFVSDELATDTARLMDYAWDR